MQDARRSSNRKRLHGKVGMSSISVFLLLLLPVPFLPSLPAIHGNEIKKSYSASPPFFPIQDMHPAPDDGDEDGGRPAEGRTVGGGVTGYRRSLPTRTQEVGLASI